MTDRAWFSRLVTSSQETEWVYSYNPEARTGILRGCVGMGTNLVLSRVILSLDSLLLSLQ